MKPNKFLSFALSLAVSSSLIAIPVSAEETQNITAYLSVSKYGEFVSDKDGNAMTLVPVELTGKTSYTLDDAFTAAHDMYYDGDGGYSSADGSWGAYITELWGDTGGNVGYQVNGGNEYVSGLTYEVKDGDCIDAIIYKNYYPETESYSKFNAYFISAAADEDIELTLYQAGYDDDWNTVFSSCTDAVITIDGEETDITTDENGNATLTFDSVGTYTVSASKQKTVNEESVPAITAPVCKVTVTDEISETEEPTATEDTSEQPSETTAPTTAPQIDAETAINNIAKKLSENGISSDPNMHWFIADMAMYAEAYPESSFVLSESEKQLCINALINDAQTATSPSALAKDIIAFRALGYDARKINVSDEEQIDIVAKLTALVDENSTSVSNVYVLPYIIIALQQSAEYATEAQINSLIDIAVANKSAWQDTTWGLDAIPPMVVALSPYYDSNEAVKNAVDEALEIADSYKSETGLISNAAVTGLMIAAHSALGNDTQNITDGLLTQICETADGFIPIENSFSTEQGLRGLLSIKMLELNKRIYDFSSYPMNEVYKFDETATPEPTDKPSGGGGSSSDDITVSLKIMTHDADKCNNSYTYKSNASKYTAAANESFTIEKGSTVYDATIYVLNKNNIEYDVDNSGYFSSICGFAEFDHGNKSGWQYSINGNYIDAGSRETELTSSCSIIWFYTDDYSKEKGSERYSSGGGGSSSVKATAKPTETPTETVTESPSETHDNITFTDVDFDAWYFDAVTYVTENNLFDGITDDEFAPDTPMTRAMLVTVLYRYENPSSLSDEMIFTDIPTDAWYSDAVKWASENKIVDGVTDTEFMPDNAITREQMAAILYRYANIKDVEISSDDDVLSYTDASDISDYALPAMKWACSTGIINGTSDSELSPQDTATRAQVATILMRFIETIGI